jgi:BirA family transcriptional regulator, biotin operon repressor / biotin---[acetyl-CoA-carboxylase] ligase
MPVRGSYLDAMSDALTNQERLRSLRAASPCVFLGENIRWVGETASSNDDCRRLTAEWGGRSVVVLADRQTAGRGQYGRRWEAPAGLGVLMSFSLPETPPANPILSIWAAAATAMMLEREFGLQPRVKWPNDVLVGGRKIAGVLVEVSGVAVIGIGLNVLQQPSDFPDDCRLPPTSIAIETGLIPDRVEVAATLLDDLERLAAPSLLETQDRVFDAWRSRLDVQPGDSVVATLHDGTMIEGEFLELTLRDGLRLQMEERTSRIPLARLIRLESSK